MRIILKYLSHGGTKITKDTEFLFKIFFFVPEIVDTNYSIRIKENSSNNDSVPSASSVPPRELLLFSYRLLRLCEKNLGVNYEFC